MDISGIVFHFRAISSFDDHTFIADIPFAGDDHILLRTERSSFESTVKKYKLSQETIDQFKKLIIILNGSAGMTYAEGNPVFGNSRNADYLRAAHGHCPGGGRPRDPGYVYTAGGTLLPGLRSPAGWGSEQWQRSST